MTRNWQHFGSLAAVLACVGMSSQVASAQSVDEETYEEIVTVGTRSGKPRSAADSTVPIDVINADDFTALGNTADLTDNIRAMVPSYNATPATGDGSAFVRNTSLRGTASDQTLVLVNGKRRHRSALIQFLAPSAGAGAHGVDVGMIPGIAVKRVEVLRDGAASQYGSDAIAGVINFMMKDADSGGDVQVTYGEHFEGEASMKVAANAGFAAGDSGFVNVSAEYVDNEGLSRGGLQVSSAQAVIDGGGPGASLVGQDAVFGDAPFAQTWGRPETKGLRFFVNSGFDISGTAELYARFSYADTEGRYRFFYRPPDHDTFVGDVTEGEDFSPQFIACPAPACVPGSGEIMSLRDMGFTGLQGGFTPFLDGEQKDSSIVLGVQGEYESGMLYDFSFGFGKNELSYFLKNTSNRSLGPGNFTDLPQTNFDNGGYEQKELNLNADFSVPLSDSLNLAFGAEWRDETYTAIAGEPTSYFGEGASGLKGVTADDGVAVSRDNVALYADVEHDISDALLLQYALRFEDFSDFGSTINWKVAGRFRASDSFAIRGAVSTGFHAPTPGQANVRTTITTADSSSGVAILIEEGLLPPTDPAAVAVGGTALREETSFNLSLGFTADFGDNTTLTADIYKIEVDDRIYKTKDIPVADPTSSATIAFFNNALDVEHSGLDIVLTSGWDWSSSMSTDLTFAFNYNEVEVVGQNPVNAPTGPTVPVNASTIEDIENDYPNERFVLTANTYFNEDLNFLIRANYYGEHHDERGTHAGSPEDDGGDPALPTGFCCVQKSIEIGAVVYVDLELGYRINDNWRVVLGGINVFDEFIDRAISGTPSGCISCNSDEWANRESVGLQYPRRGAANYEGGAWYLKGTYSFD